MAEGQTLRWWMAREGQWGQGQGWGRGRGRERWQQKGGGEELRSAPVHSEGDSSPVPPQDCSWPSWTGMAQRTLRSTTRPRRAAGSWL